MRRLLAVTAILLALASEARAQAEFPDHPITIVSPYAAGGPSDVTTRVLAVEMGKVLNQTVLVINRGGAGTMIGTQQVARSRPDGYTLLQTAGSYTINPAVRRNMPFDTLRDFTNIAIVLTSPHAIVASPGFGPGTMQALIAESRRRERPFTFASSGVGSAAHLAGELIQSVTGVTWEHVPYNGQNEAAGDILAGRVDFAVTNWSDARASVEAGKLKVLAIGFPTRLPEAPDYPTLVEAVPEMAGLPIGGWNGVAAPAGLPPEILARLTDAIRIATTSDSYRQRILAVGAYPTDHFIGPDEADRFIRNEIRVWTELVQRQGIRVD
jgi:tripartite-type tricarboxylate transporter receptor subunit TctC